MDRLERLLNLVIALRESRRPLTAEDVRTTVAGYGQERGAFRRMFERDKADLRELGVPVDVVTGTDEVAAYRIDPQRYDLPPIELAPDELAAVALAVEATGLGDDAATGLAKLEVDAGAPGARRGLPTPRVAVDLSGPHRDVLLSAAATRRQVRFTYRNAAGERRRRTVEPHGLVHRGGRWYLVGHDRGRDAQRAFRLDRIVGSVAPHGEPGAFAAPGTVDVDDVVPPASEPTTVTVLAKPDVAWAVARRARGAGEPAGALTRYRVAVGDVDELTGWVAEHSGAVVVEGPDDIRAAVLESLAALEAAHSADLGIPEGES